MFNCKTPEDVKSLVSSGAKIDTRNAEEATPLIVHAKMNRVEVAKELINLRANVDLQDARGYSALIVAARGGSWEIVQILVANGAILDLKEKEVSLVRKVEPRSCPSFKDSSLISSSFIVFSAWVHCPDVCDSG